MISPNTGDKVLAKAVASRLIHALRQQCRRGLIDGAEKYLGARVWLETVERWRARPDRYFLCCLVRNHAEPLG
jgi:hypothetical protein